MAHLLHITTPAAWAAAQAAGDVYRADTLETAGFIHLCTPEQLSGVLERWFPGEQDLVVLRLDRARIEALDLRWETAPHGGDFPHLYEPLPLDAVVLAEPL